MKTKTLTTFVTTACLLLMCLLLHTGASAQQATKATVGGARNGSQPSMMVEQPQAQSRLANGGVIIDDNGTVQMQVTTEQGNVETVLVSRPSIDLKQSVDAGFDTYVANYTTWMKANPDYANYVTPQELSDIQANNFSHLYKGNYIMSQKQAAATK